MFFQCRLCLTPVIFPVISATPHSPPSPTNMAEYSLSSDVIYYQGVLEIASHIQRVFSKWSLQRILIGWPWMGNTASKAECGEGYWAWRIWRGVTRLSVWFAGKTRMDCGSSEERSRLHFTLFSTKKDLLYTWELIKKDSNTRNTCTLKTIKLWSEQCRKHLMKWSVWRWREVRFYRIGHFNVD